MPLHKSNQFLTRSVFSLLFLTTINTELTHAQIVPDGTLPTVVQQLQNMRKITGGERVGNNLFHSFEEFSIPAGTEAIFENAADIQNIFTRITGNEASFIDGLLQTAGGANFFLVNPNGIVFGENAQLDVGGSFIATTADRVEFADGKTFAARGNQKPILTWNAPIGLGLDGNNGSITVNGNSHQIKAPSGIRPLLVDNTEFSGISVNPGKTLALIGGDVTFNGGKINVSSGRIEIGSVDTGNVTISPTDNYLNFDYSNTTGKEISLTNQALVYATEQKDFNGESPELAIAVTGENVTLSNGSYILLQNENATLGNLRVNANNALTITAPSEDATIPSLIGTQASGSVRGSKIELFGNNITIKNGVSIGANNYGSESTSGIEINATEKIILQGERPQTGNVIIGSGAFGTGKGGNTIVSTPSLSLIGAAGLTSPALGSGSGGNVTVKAETITLEGNSTSNPFISSPSFRQGNGGSITVETSQLTITNGGTINSSALATGNAGNITINAAESIEIIGKNDQTTRLQSSVTLTSEAGRKFLGIPEIPEAKAGDITITTPVLKLSNGAFIGVENQGIGDGGKVTINADNLIVEDTGRITAAAESGIGGNIELNTQNLNISNDSQITTTAGGNENGGNITINTSNLTAKKNNQITTSSFEGDGGNIKIDAADSISLNDQDEIAATSESGNGGNITLNTDQLQLQNNSSISASAGAEGNGGNIDITADTIVALKDSDITATAFKGNGGNITITADGILGIEERKATPDNGTSDIDASSEFGEDGTVVITNPQTVIQDPIIAVREIDSTDPRDKSNNDCWNGNFDRRKRRLVYVGRGGFSPDPEDFNDGTDHYITAPGFVAPEPEPEDWDIPAWQEGDPLIEANAVRVDSNGEVYLVAELESEKAKSLVCDVQETEETEEEKATVTNRQSN